MSKGRTKHGFVQLLDTRLVRILRRIIMTAAWTHLGMMGHAMILLAHRRHRGRRSHSARTRPISHLQGTAGTISVATFIAYGSRVQLISTSQRLADMKNLGQMGEHLAHRDLRLHHRLHHPLMARTSAHHREVHDIRTGPIVGSHGL